MSAILEVRGLEASYGDRTVLRGLDFEVAEGGVTALLGANGAGKTTTLRAICGTVRRRGEIRFAGKRIERMPTESIVRLGIAQVPEGRGTFATLTTEENLHLGAMTRPNGRDISLDIERCYSIFPRLKERRSQQAGTLSGGEQQMLAIARALMLRPKLMLLDEPSFGLAPMITKHIFEILAEVKRESGVSMLIVEQNASLALRFADQAYLIETGSIVMSGEAKIIREDEGVRASYLGY
ncbi:amino acid/amide ABC transporter ATP-binding protein 2 (HAAT family) [Roseiarcus fermentans]|uniref:Amino acid/amide ABC transporter ATP-binding protein 2 (HAAT family) n=1 Tax=Roseiarcus fermentans TaxID=1473586 RepID=A0A366F5G8_9HYPH|nr:ABC transporter ATP-binding protein [Roseiarcus fermentans]RBP09892.1 amino acid/amide ABC transporter ATP-binding protein 2 (HAAT family) [Roseiarcus fermentans]